MLHIGPHTYELVRGQSGFVLWLERRRHIQSLQHWRLDAHFVPSDQGPSARADGIWEYLRFTVFPHDYQVRDWRQLNGLGLGPLEAGADESWLGLVSIENLLAPQSAEEHSGVNPGDLKMRHTGDYRFVCEFDGFMQWHGREESVRFLEEIPFAQVCLRVPVNATDPVANAHARAVREIGSFEIADGRVTRHDWRREKDPTASLDNGHQVVLHTPWRNASA